jgi:intracellular sulfur oxidation DsrE/DsrF family protein
MIYPQTWKTLLFSKRKEYQNGKEAKFQSFGVKITNCTNSLKDQHIRIKQLQDVHISHIPTQYFHA